MSKQAFLKNLLCAQFVASVDQSDLRCVVGEIERFLDRGVAASDDTDLLAPEKEPVASGTGRDAETLVLLFTLQTKPLCLGARRDDNGI